MTYQIIHSKKKDMPKQCWQQLMKKEFKRNMTKLGKDLKDEKGLKTEKA